MKRIQLMWMCLYLLVLMMILTLLPTRVQAAPPKQGEGREVQASTLYNEEAELYEAQKYEEALARFQAALAIFQEINDRQWEGYTLSYIGDVYYALGQYQEALKYHEEALAIFREIDDREGEGMSLDSIGTVCYKVGQYQESLRYYEEALAISRELGLRAEEGATLQNIGNVYERLGQYQKALEYYEEAFAISRELDDEVIELSRALIYAGAPTIVASLWTVDDMATGELMASFYKHLKGGLGKAEALRAAQIEMLRTCSKTTSHFSLEKHGQKCGVIFEQLLSTEKYAHAYYWAGFVLSGELGEMSGYQPPKRETPTAEPTVTVTPIATPTAEPTVTKEAATATPLHTAKVTAAPVEETPKEEETPTPAKRGGGPCPAGALILALDVGVVFIANKRIPL
jgi:tetratricopeptide (TPR) repeat protein